MSQLSPAIEALRESHVRLIGVADRLAQTAKAALIGEADPEEMFAVHHEYLHSAQGYFTAVAVIATYVLKYPQAALTNPINAVPQTAPTEQPMTTEPETTETPTETIPPFNEPGPPQEGPAQLVDFVTVYPYLIVFAGFTNEKLILSSDVMELPNPISTEADLAAVQNLLNSEFQQPMSILNFQALQPFEKAIPLTPPPPPAEPLTPSA